MNTKRKASTRVRVPTFLRDTISNANKEIERYCPNFSLSYHLTQNQILN
jgi:hypothetical protein